MDIDKDIEILKEFKEKGFVSLMIKYDKDRIQANTMVKTAIEKVLWALKWKDCVIETQSHNEEVLEEYIAKLEQELETYKKIAYKLAEEIDNYDTYNENEKYCQFVYGFCILKDKKCVDCIIEWARKEVEKDDR